MDYEKELSWFRTKSKEIGTNHQDSEYIDYLGAWFGDGPCDGVENYYWRHRFHLLPMSQNEYFGC